MENIWSPLLAVFSVIFEKTEDVDLYNLCIEGMSKTICLLSLLNLQYQKKAVISGICKATSLYQTKELTQKNINCIKKIFELSLSDSNNYFRGGCRSNLKD